MKQDYISNHGGDLDSREENFVLNIDGITASLGILAGEVTTVKDFIILST